MKRHLSFLFICICCIAFAQEHKSIESDIEINTYVNGTLALPEGVDKPNLVIFIAGSGPTDRNGNQNFLKTDMFKKLSEALTKKGLATFRYDKRVVKQIKMGKVAKNILFDDFITDAKSVLHYFKSKSEFKKIYIAGHSQGSLVGMIAAKEGADGFISIAGAGQPIDAVILDQLQQTAPMFTEEAKAVFKVLKQGKTTNTFPEALSSIFNKDVQPFISNWMSYNPEEEIKTLQIPILIINGTNDLQVSTDEAMRLHSAAKGATLNIIEHMNHVLVEIEGDRLENAKSYNEPLKPIAPKLIEALYEFIK